MSIVSKGIKSTFKSQFVEKVEDFGFQRRSIEFFKNSKESLSDRVITELAKLHQFVKSSHMLFQSEQTVLRFEEIEAKIAYFVNNRIRILRSILNVLGSRQNQQSIDQVQFLNHGQSNSLAFLIVDNLDNFVELFEKIVTRFHTHEPETFESQLYLVIHH